MRLIAAVGAGHEKPSDLVLSSLVRGRFGELLAPRVPHGESDLFLMGLLSLIDAMLETPMAEILEKIPIDHATKAVLLGRPSPLRSVFQLMLAHESGEWEAAATLSEALKLDSEDVASCYWQAQQWARELASGALRRWHPTPWVGSCAETRGRMHSCAKPCWTGPCGVARGRVT